MKVAVIAPHADDEVIGCGGVIQHHVADGDEVHAVIVSDRVYGHTVDPDYVEKTRAETMVAKELLRYDRAIFLGLRDEMLDMQQILVIRALEEQTFGPYDRVYLPWKEDTNQDHRAVFAAGMVAFRSASDVLAYETPGSTSSFDPKVYCPMAAYQLGWKLLAFKAYESEQKPSPHPRSRELMEALAKVRGARFGCEFAEAFEAVRCRMVRRRES